MDAKRRGELKRQYAETPRPVGVFKIENTENGKLFIAGGKDVRAAINKHRSSLMFGSHMNDILQSDWNTFGADSFLFEILDFFEPDDDPDRDYSDDLAAMQALWIENLRPWNDRGYNKPPKE